MGALSTRSFLAQALGGPMSAHFSGRKRGFGTVLPPTSFTQNLVSKRHYLHKNTMLQVPAAASKRVLACPRPAKRGRCLPAFLGGRRGCFIIGSAQGESVPPPSLRATSPASGARTGAQNEGACSLAPRSAKRNISHEPAKCPASPLRTKPTPWRLRQNGASKDVNARGAHCCSVSVCDCLKV